MATDLGGGLVAGGFCDVTDLRNLIGGQKQFVRAEGDLQETSIVTGDLQGTSGLQDLQETIVKEAELRRSPSWGVTAS